VKLPAIKESIEFLKSAKSLISVIILLLGALGTTFYHYAIPDQPADKSPQIASEPVKTQVIEKDWLPVIRKECSKMVNAAIKKHEDRFHGGS